MLRVYVGISWHSDKRWETYIIRRKPSVETRSGMTPTPRRTVAVIRRPVLLLLFSDISTTMPTARRTVDSIVSYILFVHT
jgi:hypothetical protein